ncbi:ABC transporter ATP-binding protein [Achromobacter sp. GG226]|uniref:ABC transporter ATP-binding protein n=1 Tax=Verticiella alkaliphila TaxID=2779529 RepID=UPI001C0D86FF|nr:ABC transporter ATP-binding protein [Verticiella sp. GG226]MBU4609657.1 ABC transporter ATP-binding protein [Verticiella sp. GG226]
MLRVQGLTKRFGGVVAVDNASLDVAEGRIVALIGPNGAGKTTLFTMVSGFQKPDTGTVTYQNQDITGMAPHAICQMGVTRTFQIVQPFAGLSVRENIAIGSHLHHPKRADALAEAAVVAESLGMKAMLDRPAQDLTVAGRKRLELARALATRPKLLLLDEVMAGLIPSEVLEIIPMIRKIRDSGVTILLIEHVMQAVMSLSEEAYVLAQGKMIAHGTPQQLVADPTVIEAYLGHGAAERLKAEHANA